MEENFMSFFIEKSRKYDITLDEIVSIIKWVHDELKFDYEEIGEVLFDSLIVYADLQEVVKQIVHENCVADLLDMEKEEFLSLNRLFELNDKKIVQFTFMQ